VLCEDCKKNKAIINFTQIIDNKVTTYHLCEKCAENKGVNGKDNLHDSPLNNFISEIGSHLEEEKDQTGGKACGSCGSSFKEIKESGKLGCPQCYFTYEQELGSLLRRIQGSQVHVGKRLRSPGSKLSSKESRLVELRKMLEESVHKEEFEKAAMLRDEIHGLEGQESIEGVEDSGSFSSSE
jgi:protein arginine kinase activator